MRKEILFILGVVLLSYFVAGCSSGKMERLMTLKALGDEQKNLNAYIDEQDQKFERLLETVRNQRLILNMTRSSIQEVYGDPVYEKEVIHNGQKRKQCLYRYTTQFFNSPKVYLYFDEEGKLKDWRVQLQ